jgi:cytochrome c peroxidase
VEIAFVLSAPVPPAPPIPPTPAFLPSVVDSPENPNTPEKVALGHLLFFDKRISKDGSMACESCHHPNRAWTDGQAVSAKVGGALNTRNSPTMVNLAYHTSFYWDGRMPTLEAVCNAAWTGQLGAKPDDIAQKLNGIASYRPYFQRAFDSGATSMNVPMALASFLRALKSGDAPWDKFEQGDQRAVTKQVKAGFQVFRHAGCAACHVPPLYTDLLFHNVGIGSDKPADKQDHGRMNATKDPKDDGQFKTPTLRNIELTDPYFHDGSVASLDQAIDLMIAGGIKNPNLDEKLKHPVKVKPKDRKALKAFLLSLTGTSTFTGPPTALPE